MLTLVDKWPHQVRRRHRSPVNFISKKVIITSSLPPEKIYKNIEENDSLEQLYRRFKVYKCISKTQMIEHKYKQTEYISPLDKS